MFVGFHFFRVPTYSSLKVTEGVGSCEYENKICAWCSTALIVLGACLYMVWNSSGVSMALVVVFWICSRVVIPYVYSLSKNFWDCILDSSVELVYAGVDFHVSSS